MTIDRNRLPGRVLLDSSVFTAGLFPHQPEHASAKEFLEAMVAEKREMIISTLSITEFLRKHAISDIPRTKSFRTVVFDQKCAVACARHFEPSAFGEEARAMPGTFSAYWKFDALIVATAIAYKADCIVTRDEGQKKMANRAAYLWRDPNDFRAAPPAQLTLGGT